eukprot:5260494-Amphidinium_carterae.1
MFEAETSRLPGSCLRWLFKKTQGKVLGLIEQHSRVWSEAQLRHDIWGQRVEKKDAVPAMSGTLPDICQLHSHGLQLA